MEKKEKTFDIVFWVFIFYFFWIVMERYEIVKDIGSGNFGVARLVRDKWTRELFAVKFIERGQKVNSHLFFLAFIFKNYFLGI